MKALVFIARGNRMNRGVSVWGAYCGTDYILWYLPLAFMVYGVLNMVPSVMVQRLFGHPTAWDYGFLVAVVEIITLGYYWF